MSNKKAISLLFLALLAVTAFELFHLAGMSLWHDEAFSALLIKYDLQEMIYRIGLDVHPPLYYLFLRGWAFIFSDSVFVLRAFSVFFSVLMILAVYFFVKEAFKKKKLALFVSILAALNSFQIQFAMEARMFAFGTFLIVLSSFLLLKALKSKKWLWWILYALTVSCGIYTHYYIFFSVLAQGLFIIYWIFKESKETLKFALGAYGLVILSYLPWLKTFLNQASQVQESYWIPSMNLWSVPATFFKLTTGEGADFARFWYISIILMIVIIGAVIYALKNFKSSAKWLVFLLLTVPFLGAAALSLKTSIYLDRYFVFALPFYLILMGGAILLIKSKNKWVGNILVVAAILGSLIAFPLRLANLEVEKKPGMKEAAAYLNQEVKPNDKIYVGSSFIYFTFKYYNQTGVYPLLYAPVSLAHFSGTALLSPEDTIGNLNQGVKKDDTIWLINTTGFGNYQPEVPGNWSKKEEKGFEDVYDYRGWIVVTKYQAHPVTILLPK